MIFVAALYVSLILFSLGLIYKISTWFRYSLDNTDSQFSTLHRFLSAIKGIIRTIFSSKILILFNVFIFDIIFLRKSWRSSKLGWVMHLLILWGFLLLLCFHALDNLFTAKLVSDYYPSQNPFLFLRDFFGVMVIAGIVIAMLRRFIFKNPRQRSASQDIYAIIILAIILLSGIILKGTMMTSYTEFQQMVEDYAGLSPEDDADEIEALESYWVNNFALLSLNVKKPFDSDVLELGMQSHEANCISCHSPSQWAFLSYGAAKALQPAKVLLNLYDFSKLFWYIHFLTCFIGLAYLPFSKMFHVIVVPISLLTNAVMDSETSDPANMQTKQIMELDACTHCGACTLQCRVGIAVEEIPNYYILPSEKITPLKALAAGKKLTRQQWMAIQDGLHLCTNCLNCTGACPSGIDLQSLWFNARESLIHKGLPEFFIFSPLSFYRGLKHIGVSSGQYERPLKISRGVISHQFDVLKNQKNSIKISTLDRMFQKNLLLSTQGKTSFACFSCTTCSVACPVVLSYDTPIKELGLLPHQIIRSANLGLYDLAFYSNMLWSCLGCYECQDACPQGVRVADVFYELKNLAIQHLNGKIQQLNQE